MIKNSCKCQEQCRYEGNSFCCEYCESNGVAVSRGEALGNHYADKNVYPVIK